MAVLAAACAAEERPIELQVDSDGVSEQMASEAFTEWLQVVRRDTSEQQAAEFSDVWLQVVHM